MFLQVALIGSNGGSVTQCSNIIENDKLYYKNPLNESQHGIPFHIDQNILRNLRMPPTQFITLDSRTVKDFVVVTACSADHFAESMDAIASVQTELPGKHIIYYDIGLNDNQVSKVTQMGFLFK